MSGVQTSAHGTGRASDATGSATVLVVEDDAALREALCDTLSVAGYPVAAATDGVDALERLDADERIGMVLSDVKMPRMDGHAFLSRVSAERPGLPVLMMTAFGNVDGAVRAMRDGAVDYLVKPVDRDALLGHVRAHLPALEQLDDPEAPIAVDPRSREVLRLAERVAPTEATVMISGESGTGKEVLARHVHARSRRAAHPFVAINCAAIPESMLEATLFGHEKGAFTGAHRSLPGKFEQANGGTLLLDEVTEMNVDLQSKLLRVLQEREVERVGSRDTVSLDVRVLATTNRDLLAEVSGGRFREDLFYRLNVFPIALAALRERPGDILPIARRLLARHAGGSRASPGFSPDAEAALLAHHWPGNVRELDNAVQRAVVMSVGASIEAGDLSLTTAGAAAPASPARAVPTAPPGESGLKDRERQIILETLASFGGSRKQTAQRLGISPRTLRYKLARMREQGIDVPGATHGGPVDE